MDPMILWDKQVASSINFPSPKMGQVVDFNMISMAPKVGGKIKPEKLSNLPGLKMVGEHDFQHGK